MDQYLGGVEQDRNVAPQAPAVHIFEIGAEAIFQILALHGRASIATDLCEASNAGFQRMAHPIAFVHFPEQLVASE